MNLENWFLKFLNVCSQNELPVLPPKRIFSLRKFDTDFIESRKKALDTYLKELIIVNKKAKLDCLLSFLDVEVWIVNYD